MFLPVLLLLLAVLHSLQRMQSEYQRAQEEARHAAAKLQRQQREWQQQLDDVRVRVSGGIEQLQAALAAASHQEGDSGL